MKSLNLLEYGTSVDSPLNYDLFLEFFVNFSIFVTPDEADYKPEFVIVEEIILKIKKTIKENNNYFHLKKYLKTNFDKISEDFCTTEKSENGEKEINLVSFKFKEKNFMDVKFNCRT